MTSESKAHPADVLGQALALIDERGLSYGGVEKSFERAARIATLALNRDIHPYEVMVILRSVKQARQAVNPAHLDSHIDAINYEAFAATEAESYAMWRAVQEVKDGIAKSLDNETSNKVSGSAASEADPSN